MKQITEYFKDKRNWYHVLVGVTVGYCIIKLFRFNNRENFPFDFTLSWDKFDIHNFMLPPFVPAVVLLIISFLWERQQDKVKENTSDMRDVYCSGVSGLIGGYFAMAYFSYFVAVPLLFISLIVVINHFKK